MLKKVVSIILVFSMVVFGVFANNNNVVNAQSKFSKPEQTINIQKYLSTENINYEENTNEQIYSITYDDVIYKLTYSFSDETYEAKAYESTTGKELDIEQLKESQMQEGKTVAVASNNQDDTVDAMFAIPLLIPVAAWAFEHLIAMALAAALVSVIAVSKDKIKAELESRLKRKNPKIIYRGGSSTAYNLTPRAQDTGGLSYYLNMPTGKFTATTKEAVDGTKVLKAVVDTANHVSVKPVNSSAMKGWIDSKAKANEKPHEFTKLLQAISVSSSN